MPNMIIFVGNKTTKQIVYESGNLICTTPENTPTDAGILENVISQYGGTTTDYDILRVSADNQISRVEVRDNFNPVWNGNTISALTFSAEDNKKVIKFLITDINDVPKNIIIANGINSLKISACVFNPDGSIDTTFGDTINIPMYQPNTIKTLLSFPFFNGKRSFTFKVISSGVGLWRLYGKTDYSNKNLKIPLETNITISATAA